MDVVEKTRRNSSVISSIQLDLEKSTLKVSVGLELIFFDLKVSD